MTIKIKVILGTTRQKRFGDKPAHWICEEARLQQDVEVELLDLRDYPLPFFDEPMSPMASKGHTRNRRCNSGRNGSPTVMRSSWWRPNTTTGIPPC